MGLAIRDAEPGDAGEVSRLLGLLGYPASTDEARSHIERFARDPSSRLQVAAASRPPDLLGLLATHVVPRLNADLVICRITELVVDPSSRRRGIGEALLGAAEEEARRQGARRIELSSGE